MEAERKPAHVPHDPYTACSPKLKLTHYSCLCPFSKYSRGPFYSLIPPYCVLGQSDSPVSSCQQAYSSFSEKKELRLPRHIHHWQPHRRWTTCFHLCKTMSGTLNRHFVPSYPDFSVDFPNNQQSINFSVFVSSTDSDVTVNLLLLANT